MAGLKEWFKQDWVDITPRKKVGVSINVEEKLQVEKRKYPKCVPAAKAARMTDISEKECRCKEKK